MPKLRTKIASEKANLGEKVGKYNRLAVANDCVEMKEVKTEIFPGNGDGENTIF